MKTKVAVIGAGAVGAATALRLAEAGVFDVALIDVVEGMPEGKALDIRQAGAIAFSDASVYGGSDFGLTEGSRIAIIAAGMPRFPGMTREALLEPNAEIVASAVGSLMRYCDDPIIIVATNPLDAMCHVALQASGLPSHRVIGMAGILDSARLCTFIADALKVSVRNVDAIVVGGHGETMVPLVRFATVAGVPITDLLDGGQIEQIIEQTREAGDEIVRLLASGGASLAPSAAILEMVRAINRDQHQILPCSALLKGEYGIEGVYVGVPCVMGARGLERIVEFDLSVDELLPLRVSAEAVRAQRDRLNVFG